jgi:chaperonin GroES
MKESQMAKAGEKKAAKCSQKSKCKVRPLGEKVLVRRLEAETMTGIVLPDTAKEKPRQGTVLALGDGKLLDDGTRAKFQVAVGDKVLFSSYAGTDIKVDGKELMLMDENDILAVLG